MYDRLVHRTAGGAEIGKLGVLAVALQHIDGRDRLPADLVGGGALDDGPVHPAGLAVLFDVLEAAIDNRVGRVELALDLPRRSGAPAAPGSAAPPIVASTIAPVAS